jgi:hypothetical protein
MSEPQASQPKALITAIRRLMRPLVRVLIAHDIGFPLFAEMLKGVYLETAARYFRLESGRRMTDSRLSLLTGVHRKDVKRLREMPAEAEGPPRRVSLSARVIGLWSGDSDYLDANGRPRELDGEGFDQLVESVSKDVRPRTLLDEWLQQGLVERTEGEDGSGRIRLCAEAFVPSEGLEEMAFYFGRNLHDHIAAAGENLLGIGKPRLERAVYYPGLTRESVEELEALARDQAMAALQNLNKAILERQRRDQGRDDAHYRFAFGTYLYASDEREQQAGEEPR